VVEDQAVLNELCKTCLDSRERCFAEVDRTKGVQCRAAIAGERGEYLLCERQMPSPYRQDSMLRFNTLDVSP
jgi:hypothetical protein